MANRTKMLVSDTDATDAENFSGFSLDETDGQFQNAAPFADLPEPFPGLGMAGLPGAVCVQWRKCGKPNCHCASGKKHGPYYVRFWYEGRQQRQEYIKPADVEAVRAVCETQRKQKREVWQTVQESALLWRRLKASCRAMGW